MNLLPCINNCYQPAAPVRFGWKSADKLPDDFGYVYVEDGDIEWSDELRSYQTCMPFEGTRVLEFRIPSPTLQLVSRVGELLKRNGRDALKKPGFAYVVTPFKSDGLPQDALDVEYAKARSLAMKITESVYQQDRGYYVPASRFQRFEGFSRLVVDISSRGPSTYADASPEARRLDQELLDNQNAVSGGYQGIQSSKLPHYDRAEGLLTFVQGTNRGVQGGAHRLSDVHDYLSTNKLSPAEVFGYVEWAFSNVGEPAHVQKLLDEYSIEIKPVEGQIGILIINNFANQSGVLHGATPLQITESDYHRQFFQYFYPQANNRAKERLKAFCRSTEKLPAPDARD